MYLFMQQGNYYSTRKLSRMKVYVEIGMRGKLTTFCLGKPHYRPFTSRG